MLMNTRMALGIAVLLGANLAMLGCGGVGAAPFNGVGSLPAVTVSVLPSTMNIPTGTTQAFTATVNNTSEAGVGWLVNGLPGGINPADGSSPFGLIDKDGNYTAPPFIPDPSTVTVTAVANADNTAKANASASITGTPSPVSISPTTASLQIGRTINGIEETGGIALFSATVRGSDSLLNWLVENKLNGDANVGTITLVPGPFNQVVYTAPVQFPSQGTQIHVTAQSFDNPTETASAVITLLSVGSTLVEITSPRQPPTVQLTETQAFVASVTGNNETSVSWQVDGIPGGNANVGTISAAGIYTAPSRLPIPPLSPQVIVTAVSNADAGAQASILVNLVENTPITVAVTTDPTACANTNAIPINSTLQFNASVNGGATSQVVTWQVQHVTGGNAPSGTITPDGFYTAPAQVPLPATVVVSAVSVDDPHAVGNLPITISLTPVTAITVTPSKVSVPINQSPTDFTATVLGLADRHTNWFVNGIEFGDLDTVGEISWDQPVDCTTSAHYLAPGSIPAPPLPNPVPVTAVAMDGTTSPPILVTITNEAQYSVAISPHSDVNLMVGQTQPYQASSTDQNDSVTWSVSGKSCTGVACGTITPSISHPPQPFLATYTAPPVPPSPDNTVKVTVSSVNHPGVSDFDYPVSITTGTPSISITPTFQSVIVGQNQIPFQATITNFDQGADVAWQVQCISDWDGHPGEDCNDIERGGGGPGCILVAGGREHCGQSQTLIAPGNVQLMYVSPEKLFDTDFLENKCSGQSDDHTGYVPLTVTLTAAGCPGGQCVATACVQVKP